MVYFGVSVGSPVCWWSGLCSCLACCLGEVSSAAVLQAVEWWRPLWEFSLSNTPWGQKFSADLTSWTQRSHPRGSGPTSGQGTKTPQAVMAIKGIKTNRPKKKKAKYKTQTKGKRKIRQIETKTKEHTYRHTHIYTKEIKTDQGKQNPRQSNKVRSVLLT